jgi:hypothetical protein
VQPRQAHADCVRHADQPFSPLYAKKIENVRRKKNTGPDLYRNTGFFEPPIELVTTYSEVLNVCLLIPEPLHSHQKVKNKSECTGIIFDPQKATAWYKGADCILDDDVGIFQGMKNPRKDCDINDAGLHRNIFRIRNEIVDVAGACILITLSRAMRTMLSR